MAEIDKYFKELLQLNAVQLSLCPGSPAKYIMASGRQYKGKSVLSESKIEEMLGEILINGKDVLTLPEQFELKYDIPEKGVFSGLIEKKEDMVFSSFVLVEKYKESFEKENYLVEADEIKTSIDIDIAAEEGKPTINRLLRILVKNQSSDLHISTGEHPFIRKDGKLFGIKKIPVLSSEDIRKMIYEIISDEEKRKLDKLEEVDFSYEIRNLARFRCNIFRDLKGIAAVFRLIPIRIPTFDELDLPLILKDLAFLNRGLVLVTGPTGSGKSTTLAALIDFVNRKRDVHIITLEDPIEFVHKNLKALINQRELRKHTNSFSNALKSALREDPDVVLVGEMRDLETISTALETAETGHLVFATLHTTSAYSTVNRIVEQFPPDQQEQIKTMLADSIKAVISQTLCRKIGGGRIAAFEILLATPAVSNLIREGKTYQIPSLIQTGKKEGMSTLNDYLMRLVNSNMIETYEAYLKAVDKKGIISALRAKKYKTDFLSKLDLLEA